MTRYSTVGGGIERGGSLGVWEGGRGEGGRGGGRERRREGGEVTDTRFSALSTENLISIFYSSPRWSAPTRVASTDRRTRRGSSFISRISICLSLTNGALACSSLSYSRCVPVLCYFSWIHCASVYTMSQQCHNSVTALVSNAEKSFYHLTSAVQHDSAVYEWCLCKYSHCLISTWILVRNRLFSCLSSAISLCAHCRSWTRGKGDVKSQITGGSVGFSSWTYPEISVYQTSENHRTRMMRLNDLCEVRWVRLLPSATAISNLTLNVIKLRLVTCQYHKLNFDNFLFHCPKSSWRNLHKFFKIYLRILQEFLKFWRISWRRSRQRPNFLLVWQPQAQCHSVFVSTERAGSLAMEAG